MPSQGTALHMKLAYTLAMLLVISFASPPVVGQNEDAEAARATAAFEKGDYVTAAKLFRALAEQGYPRAQTMLGLLYDMGMARSRNLQKRRSGIAKLPIKA
jgi:uncharacterized protein